MRFLMSGFFHESIVAGLWIHIIKYFCFQEVIPKNIFVFRLTIPGRQKNGPKMTPFFCFESINQVMYQSTIGDF